jgi:hypothetical protein
MRGVRAGFASPRYLDIGFPGIGLLERPEGFRGHEIQVAPEAKRQGWYSVPSAAIATEGESYQSRVLRGVWKRPPAVVVNTRRTKPGLDSDYTL